MKKVIVMTISVILFWACNNATEKTGTQHESENHIAHDHSSSSGAMELNDGEKWQVNEEMKPYVQAGEEMVNTFISNSETDFKTLAEQLKDQNNKLIKSCTMDGKGHDELHKWLHPHLETVELLDKETDAGKAQETVQNLQNSYQLYHSYFN